MLNLLAKKYKKKQTKNKKKTNDFGLYSDDGLAVLKNDVDHNQNR